MKVLFVPNHSVLSRHGRRLVNRHTGKFLVELAREVDRLVIVQPLVEFSEGEVLSDFDLMSHPELHPSARSWPLGSSWTRLIAYLRAIPWALREVWASDFVYLFLPGRLPSLFGFAARLLRRPYGVYVRGEFKGCDVESLLGGAVFTIAANEGLFDQATQICKNTELIRPMMDLSVSDVLERRPQRRAGPWRLLFVGRVERRKGVDDLVEAAALLDEAGLDFVLDIVGGGPADETGDGGELGRIRREVADLGLGNRIVFHGMVSEKDSLAAFYRSADLFVFPTHWEGFARVLYEAMANGLPVVTTFVGGIPSVVRDGENGIRIKVHDPADLAAKVLALLEDPGLRIVLAENGARTVRRVLGPERRPHAEAVVMRLRERAAESERR